MRKLGYLLVCFFFVLGLTVSTIGCKGKEAEETAAPTEETAPAPTEETAPAPTEETAPAPPTEETAPAPAE
ncbi:MAG: hypothetical protein COZ68_06090 [Deltaproteobacteria bacterium CG_4_8_14_3_um_filter_43_13]|nr:MAG: hypothetical protein COZ68_06090 [Deltaproteobacteria bacterium CG_4_8_14_3_um_filter_43_13]